MDQMIRLLLKLLMWVLIIGFGCNFIMQTISYSFYKNAKKMKNINFSPVYIEFNEKLSGYGLNLKSESDTVILLFGGSNYIAYYSVGCFSGIFKMPFISAELLRKPK